jgi:hypothetical protein
MKAKSWTTWEKHLPSSNVQTRTKTSALCLKPWDQILPEEGIEERLACREQLWRTWEKYLPLRSEDATANLLIGSVEERPEKVLV